MADPLTRMDLTPGRPRLWFVSPALGRSSEPWLLRQISNLRALQTSAVCWSIEDQRWVQDLKQPLHVAPFVFDKPGRMHRWIRCGLNLAGGNFYAGGKAERRWLLKLAEREQPDVMLCHFGYAALRMLPVAKQIEVPLVAHFHGLDASSLLRGRWYRWSLQRYLREFAAVIVVGSRQREWALGMGVKPERLHLIPCGVPTKEFSPPPRPSDGPLRFIAVCRLVAWKGVDLCIRALGRISRLLPDARLVVIGDGPEAKPLEKLIAELGLSERVKLLGAQPPEVVCDELRQSHIFLQHSLEMNGWYEGFGVSLAEAAAMGLPVIASRTGGIMDQVKEGETGFLVPLRDVGAMAEAMLLLGTNRLLREQMGNAGRQRMIEKYDTISQVRKLEDVLVATAKGENKTEGAPRV